MDDSRDNATSPSEAPAPLSRVRLVGALLLVALTAVGVFLIWRAGGSSDPSTSPRNGTAPSQQAGIASFVGGVQARQADAPTRPGAATMRTDLLGGRQAGVAPDGYTPKTYPKNPPEDATTDEKRVFYQKAHQRVRLQRDSQQRMIDRLPAIRESQIKRGRYKEEEWKRRVSKLERQLGRTQDELARIESQLLRL